MKNVELTLAAEEDLSGIWLYTHDTWSFDQAEKYYDQIVLCCEAVGSGRARAKPVEGLTDDIHAHRCEQHYIFFMPRERPIILAILHGRMDFVRRLSERF
ncbi:MAG: type II toxin-antitoxin system RelE/ParE family toxin [Ascidiaceihabitans sp.]|uniref:type II toxin-antitoxin system RelE/ParE family toxin n=1 Tax=Rhodobacterales TaxID=204455 RepID=UPI003296EC29